MPLESWLVVRDVVDGARTLADAVAYVERGRLA